MLLTVLVLSLSAGLQLAAAALALRLIRATGRQVAWMLIASAMALQALRRIFVLTGLAGGRVSPGQILGSEVVGLVLSVLMVCGVALISPFFGLLGDTLARREAQNRDLRESEERLRAVFDSADDAIFVKDRDLKYVRVNRAMAVLFGLAPDLILGRTDAELFSPEEATEIVETDRRVLAGEVQVDTPERTIQGRTFIFHTIKTPVHDADGAVVGLCGIARDITQIRQAEEALKASELKYRGLFENFVAGVFRTAPDGRLIEVNPAYARMFGFASPEEIMTEIVDIGRQLYFNPADRNEIVEALGREGSIQGHECRFVHRDGTPFWGSVTSQAVKDAQGRVLHYEGTIIDISERKRAEEALQDISRKNEEAMDASRTAYWEFDVASEAFILNDRFFRLHGIPPGTAPDFRLTKQEFLGGHVLPSFANQIGRAISEAVESSDPDYQAYLEGKLVRPNDEEIWIGTWLRRMADQTGRTVQIHGVNQDITSQKQMELALVESQSTFKALFDNASDAIFIHDPEQHGFLEVNREACRRLGYPREELLRLSPAQIDTPEYAGRVKARIDQLKSKGAALFETAMVKRDGTVIPTEISARTIDYGGRPVILSLARDITARRVAEEESARYRRELEDQVRRRTADLESARAAALSLMQDAELQRTSAERALAESHRMEAALGASEERIHRILETSGEGFWLIDIRGVTLDVNPSMCSILGRKREEIMGRTIFDFCDPEGARIFREQLATRALGRSSSYENVLFRPDGSSAACWFNATPYFDAQNEFVGSFALVTDVTERKRAEEELRRRAEELEAFNRTMVDREMEVIEKKREVNRLCRELGRKPAYPPVWDEDLH
jgi:PAS domain S-box-containing protein